MFEGEYKDGEKNGKGKEYSPSKFKFPQEYSFPFPFFSPSLYSPSNINLSN